MYVALTRARNHLAITFPLNSYGTRRGADYTIDQLSRFLDRGVRERMERVVPRWDDAPAAPAVDARATVDLRAVMRQRFSGGGASSGG